MLPARPLIPQQATFKPYIRIRADYFRLYEALAVKVVFASVVPVDPADTGA